MTADEVRCLQRDLERFYGKPYAEMADITWERIHRIVRFAANVMDEVESHEFNSGQHDCQCFIATGVGDMCFALHREMTP